MRIAIVTNPVNRQGNQSRSGPSVNTMEDLIRKENTFLKSNKPRWNRVEEIGGLGFGGDSVDY